jgi:chromosome condensin MukBEF complex kleisin-like MukF subunit
MTTAEIKLELFRRIDNLTSKELNEIYSQIIELIESSSYNLTSEENNAINEALQTKTDESSQMTNSVMAEAKSRYRNLRFK